MPHRNKLAPLAIELLGGFGDRFLLGLGLNDPEPLGLGLGDVDVPMGEGLVGQR